MPRQLAQHSAFEEALLRIEYAASTGARELFLFGLGLEQLPPEIGRLRDLQRLDLSNNKLENLPPEIGHLTALTHLDLRKNRLTGLPEGLRRLTKLSSLLLHDNPELGIEASVLGPTGYDTWGYERSGVKRPLHILNYYFERQRVGQKPLNEVKILLVGAGQVGKSTIVDRMVYNRFDHLKRETPGIAIADWDVDVEATKVTAHLWDFAGQEITHETHRFFLTERSLYLVVLDHRRDQESQDAVYWLRHVRQYGKDSPVIVVLNKSEEHEYDVDRNKLRRLFPNIHGFVRTRCSEVNGCNELTEMIRDAVAQMDGVRAKWPTTYLNVKDRLARLHREGKPIVSYAEFERICVECKVDDAEKRRGLSRNLHDLGAALWYGDDPRLNDTRILSPNWVANGLYGIIRGGQRNPCNRREGTVHVEDVGMLLEKAYADEISERSVKLEEYPAQHHRFLLDLLVDRDLAFVETSDNQSVYLLPSLLSPTEPEPELFDLAGVMKASEVHFRYAYSLLPSDVIARFIVQTNVLSEDMPRWKNGVVLVWRGAQAVIVMSKNPDFIEVFVQGEDAIERQELCGIIRAYMETAQAGMPEGLRGKEELALAKAPDQWKELAYLRKLAEARRTLPVEVGNKIVDVEAALEVRRVSPLTPRGRKPIPVTAFVSYSHNNTKRMKELERYLITLRNNGKLDSWTDLMLRPDDRVDEVITDELRKADLIIMLISVDFLGSWYVQNVEMPIAKQRYSLKDCRILPVVLSDLEVVKDDPFMGMINPIPKGKDNRTKPICAFNPRDNGWENVYNVLKRTLSEIRKEKDRMDSIERDR